MQGIRDYSPNLSVCRTEICRLEKPLVAVISGDYAADKKDHTAIMSVQKAFFRAYPGDYAPAKNS